ncbi:hypothetical protein ACFSX8_00030 [Acinetobacter gyllenbergii]|uniref:hypothetical protein n=1 Tax=Acinetobacter gyllenbergii TaxID=134534 RepID=UPI0036373D6A
MARNRAIVLLWKWVLVPQAMVAYLWVRGPIRAQRPIILRWAVTQRQEVEFQVQQMPPLNGGSQIAIGKNAQTDTAGSIAIGNDARTGVGQNFGVAIGGYAEATGNSAIAFGVVQMQVFWWCRSRVPMHNPQGMIQQR